MAIDKLIPLGSNGALEDNTTFEDWVDNGFVDELVTYHRLNRAFYRADSKINEILDRGPKGFLPSAGMDTVLTGIHSPGAAGTFGYDTHNELDSGDASDEFMDMALAVIGGVRKVICLDWTTALNVEIFDIDAMAYDGPQAIPASSLPQDGGNEDWRPSAIVCDSNSAYILWQDNGASSSYHYDHYVQAYSLSDWTVKAGWPSTGLFLFDHSLIQNSSNMIFATSGLLAIFDEEVTISGGTSRAVIFVNVTDGTEDSYGAGDLSSDYVRDICSNGEYIFVSAGTKIGSIDIASPSSGCGGTGWPRTVSPSTKSIECLGNVVVCNSSTKVHILNTSNANIADIVPVDATIVKTLGVIATDGLNFWVRGLKTVGATDRTCFIYKLNIQGLMQENSTTVVDAADEVFECFTVSTDDGSYMSRIIFDGDGIVGILDFNGDGRLWKLPKTALR